MYMKVKGLIWLIQLLPNQDGNYAPLNRMAEKNTLTG